MKSTEGNERLYNVTVKGESFNDVPNIPKFKKCNSSNCKHYWDCKHKGVLRPLDCKRNAKFTKTIYDIITGALAAYGAIHFYQTLQLGFFRGTGHLIIFLVCLDILCCFGEKYVSNFRENHFYKKLKNMQLKRVENENKEKEKLRKDLEESELSQIKPNQIESYKNNSKYIHIMRAENTINVLRELTNSMELGENEGKLIICIKELYAIIKKLKKDMTDYGQFENLLEIYLPSVYLVLKAYQIRKKNNDLTKVHEERLESCISMFYICLHHEKEKGVSEDEYVEKKFKAFAEDTFKMLDKGEK